MKYEDILDEDGKIGKYQLFVAALLILSTIPNGSLTTVVIFTNYTPDHRCKIPGLDEIGDANATQFDFGNKSREEILNMTIPWDKKDGELVRSQCKIVKPELWGFNKTVNYTDNDLVNCRHGWYYYIEEGRTSIVTEWDLVCGHAWVKPMITSLFNVGVTIAALFTGILADRFGRRKLFLITTYLQFITMWVSCFSVNSVMFAILYMLTGACSLTNFMAAVVLMYEVIGNESRFTAGALQMLMFSIGYMVVPLSAYLIPSWRWMLASVGFQIIFFIPYYWFVPESLQWLLLNKRYDEAKELIQTIIRWNNLSQSADDVLEKARSIKENANQKVKQLSYWHLVKYPYVRRTTIILCFAWGCVLFGYYGLTYNSTNLSGDIYITCLLSAVVEIPACIFLIVCQKFGRVKCFLLLDVIAIATSVATYFLITNNPTATTVLAILGKLLMTGLFDVLYLYTPEVYPVLLRQQGLAIASTFGRVGSISAPYLVYAAEQVGGSLLYGLMAATTILMFLLAVMLPETANTSLPSTIKEAIKLNRHSAISGSKILCCKRERNGEIEEISEESKM